MSKLSELLKEVKREHIERAIKEWDNEKRYGFGKARTCFLIYEGNHYASKAIMGGAYGFAVPDKPPLTPKDDNFYGGDPLLKELRKRGFECSNTFNRDN